MFRYLVFAFVLFSAPHLLLAGAMSSGSTLSSDYVFRGVTKTDHGPAVFGRMHYALDIGLSFGSSVVNVGADDARGVEVQPDLTFIYNLNSKFSVKVGAIYYYNPFATLADTLDYQIGLGITKYFQLSVFYTTRYFARDSSALYVLGETNFAIYTPEQLYLNLSAGYSRFAYPVNAGNKNYTDYTIGLHRRSQNSDVGLFYTGTNRRIIDPKGLDVPAKDETFVAAYTIAFN